MVEEDSAIEMAGVSEEEEAADLEETVEEDLGEEEAALVSWFSCYFFKWLVLSAFFLFI